MNYAQDFPPADAAYDPVSDGLVLGVPPLALAVLVLLLLAAGWAGWMLAQRRGPSSASDGAAIWKAVDDAIRTAMTAHSDALRDRARNLVGVIDKRLGKTLALAAGLAQLDTLKAALDENHADAGHGHDGGHGHDAVHGHGHDHDGHGHSDGADADAHGSTVLIERARHVVIHPPASKPDHAAHPPKPPTEAERRQTLRQAVAELNDHWRHKEARIAEIDAAHAELSAKG